MISPELAAKGEDLSAKFQRLQETKEEDTSWIDDTSDINFWEFRKKSFWAIYWFQTFMDNSNWDLLAEALGLNTDEIHWCRTYHQYGPTREVFCKLKLKEELKNLTLRDVLNIIRDLKQTAILKRVSWKESIDYFRGVSVANYRTTNVGYECGLGSIPSGAQRSFSLTIRREPEMLTTSSYVDKITDIQLESSCRTPAKKSPKYAAKIIMIFASDAREKALRAAKLLKAFQGARREIGVIILLSDSEVITNALLEDPGNSIYKWFKQVDFVVPVLSPQFLLQIQDRDSDPDTIEERQYNRYLYRIMLDDYVANMSKNYKCRPLYAPEFCTEVRNSELVKGNGLLQYNWDCSSEEELEKFGEILISGAREKRRRNR